jgi:hypothetical protein
MRIKKWVGNGVIIIIIIIFFFINIKLALHNIKCTCKTGRIFLLYSEYRVQTWNRAVVGIQVLCSAPASNRALFQAHSPLPQLPYLTYKCRAKP